AVPRPHPRALADCDLAGIDPGRAYYVARVARDDPGPREHRLEEEIVAEIDPLRRARVVFGVLGGRGERLEERGYVCGTRTFRGHRGFGYIADLAGGGPEEQCAEEKERSRFDDAGARPPSARPRLSMITRLHGHGFASDLGSAAVPVLGEYSSLVSGSRHSWVRGSLHPGMRCAARSEWRRSRARPHRQYTVRYRQRQTPRGRGAHAGGASEMAASRGRCSPRRFLTRGNVRSAPASHVGDACALLPFRASHAPSASRSGSWWQEKHGSLWGRSIRAPGRTASSAPQLGHCAVMRRTSYEPRHSLQPKYNPAPDAARSHGKGAGRIAPAGA